MLEAIECPALSGYPPFSIVASDLNNDGKLDLAVTNYNSYAVSVLLGNGNGTFQRRVSSKIDYNSIWMAVGDVNSDGNLDLVITGYQVRVLLGNGDGTFKTKAQNFDTLVNSNAVVIEDVNHDGYLDLVIAGRLGGRAVSILLGKGDGTFKSPVDYPTGRTPLTVAVGDVNSDSELDLVVTNLQSNTVSVLLGHGDGTFAPRVDYSTDRRPYAVAIGDVNIDDKPDLVVTGGNTLSGVGTVGVLLGNGDGTFQSMVKYHVGNAPGGVEIQDLNNDGKLDLVVLNRSSNTVSILLNATTP